MKLKLLFKISVLILLFSCILSGRIIPNKQNPFIIDYPTVATGTTTLNFNFQFPKQTKGVNYMQYIAVRFPRADTSVTNLGTTNFKFNEALASSCTLYNDANNKIVVNWVQSPTGDENICYCQITDNKTTLVPLSAGINYRLQITLPNATQKPVAIFWRNFDLFTTTHNSVNGLNIDIGNNFGSGAMFNDHILIGNQLLKIEAIEKITVGAGTFECFKTVEYDENGEKVSTRWYSDKVKTSVKEIDEVTGDTQELVSYSVQ